MEAIVLQKAIEYVYEPAQAIIGPVPDDLHLAVQEAADACPVAAIEVR